MSESPSPATRPPPADMPRIHVGLYRPLPSATPHQRLRCMLIAILASPGFASYTHRPGPYFDPTNPICWITTIENRPSVKGLAGRTLREALFDFGFTPNYPNLADQIAKIVVDISTSTRTRASKIYDIDARITAYDAAGQKIMILVGESRTVPLSIPIELEMVPPTNLPPGTFESLGWACIVAMLAFECRTSYDADGNANPKGKCVSLLTATKSPLAQYRFHGWPGEWPGESERPKRSVFRKK